MKRIQVLNLLASISLITLIFHCLAWELWFAPLRPGGSALAFKAFPLLLPLFGILRGRRYTHQWASMLILAYFAEGVVRVASDPGAVSRAMAAVEVALALVFFLSAIFYAKLGGAVKRHPGD
ncbi:hypothetical protein B9N43_01815 [Denitratisoma sp. DHT3]|uniref:DUF2069 domain-containing protein n=1 Tax=Denitratisoma sp. DHT3 TaxID=1981880 RepID=UPI00119865CB|nr:DUF2069 domain-containing protein [Denitratisoma sp. DHT3]QDX80100.1 hypothetical protein B9N43_01815 [Denitratisoma sp. DHT3]